jgi:O-antigen ligase
MLDSRRVAAWGLLLLPAGLLVYFAFSAGGYYPGPPAYIAVVLCVVLILRVTLAGSPLEGLSWPMAVAGGALAGFALLTLLSALWSHAPGRALVQFDLALVYLLVLVLFGSIGRNAARLRWMLLWLGVGALTVCVCALITRLLPNLWPTSEQLANNRLSYPVTYWNVLGMVAVVGILLCVHVTSEPRMRWFERVLAATAIPILACTLFFTFSRGSIAALVITLVAYVLIGRPRGLLSGLLAAGPPTAVALKVAYDANLLATPDPTSAGGVLQGHHVAAVLLGCLAGAAALRALLLLLDRRLVSFRLPERARAPFVRGAWATLAVAVAVAIFALHGQISHQYHRFLKPAAPGSAADLRSRLTDPGNNGRIDAWRVAWHGFQAKPVLGQGANTYANLWAIKRPSLDNIQNAHSLYLEVLDELGVVGFVLLLAATLIPLVAAAARARGPGRTLYAAVFAVLLAVALHTGIDWDWEMPVITIVFFALGGAVIARRVPEPAPGSHASAGPAAAPAGAPGWVPGAGGRVRVVMGIGLMLLAVAPAYVWLSQRKLNQATYAFSQGNCSTANRAAASSISILGVRSEPYEILGYCDVRQDRPDLAIAAINKAISLDPQNWNYAYDLAVFRAAAGLDPRAAARRALSLDPRETLTQQAWLAFRAETPAQWQVEGRNLVNSLNAL